MRLLVLFAVTLAARPAAQVGARVPATHVVRTLVLDRDELQPEHVSVLFLGSRMRARPPTREDLVLRWDAAGIYDVTDGRVRCLNTAWRYHDGKSADAFIAELRSAGVAVPMGRGGHLQKATRSRTHSRDLGGVLRRDV